MAQSPDEIRALFRFLRFGGEPPAESVDLLREQWLTPLFYLRLQDRPHPHRDTLAADFHHAFERRAKLDAAWRETGEALVDRGIECITIGSLPYLSKLFPHRAAKLSQDIDLLVREQDAPRAFEVLSAIGWHRPTGCSFLVRDNLQLDLHTTLGDEGRYPTLARAYGLAPDTLFAAKVPASETAPRGTFALRDDHYLDYRVIHFFKHYCTKLIDALELALLFERLNVNHDLLRATVAQSNSGRVWACVLCVLKVWGLEPAFDPVSDSDRAFAQTPRVRKILDEIARLDGGRSPVRLAAMMLPPNLRLRFAWELIWPRREVMLRLASRDEATWGELALIRIRRMAKTFGGVIFGK